MTVMIELRLLMDKIRPIENDLFDLKQSVCSDFFKKRGMLAQRFGSEIHDLERELLGLIGEVTTKLRKIGEKVVVCATAVKETEKGEDYESL